MVTMPHTRVTQSFTLQGSLYLPERKVSLAGELSDSREYCPGGVEGLLAYDGERRKVRGIMVNEDQFCIPHDGPARDVIILYELGRQYCFHLFKIGKGFEGEYRGERFTQDFLTSETFNPERIVGPSMYWMPEEFPRHPAEIAMRKRNGFQ